MSNRLITLHYTLTSKTGELLDTSRGQAPLSYIEGLQQIIPGLERQLGLLSAGDKRVITVPAADAYGERDERFVLNVPKEDIGHPSLKVGDEIQAKGGELEGQIFSVTEINDTNVILDANHPLAGVDLTFDVEMVSIREASKEEIEAAAHHHHDHDDEEGCGSGGCGCAH